jgi:hypothetical protein
MALESDEKARNAWLTVCATIPDSKTHAMAAYA